MSAPDQHDPGLRIYQCAKAMSVSLLDNAVSRLAVIRVLVDEVLREVPGADFIEIRAVRFDQQKGDSGERDVTPVPDA